MNPDKLREEFTAEYKAGHKDGGMRSYIFTGQNAALIADWWLTKMQEREEEIVYDMRKASQYFLSGDGKKVVGVTQKIMLDIIRNQKK